MFLRYFMLYWKQKIRLSLVVVVYRMPGPLGTFNDDSISTINELPAQDRTLIWGDFNLSQRLSATVCKVEALIQNCNFSQGSQHSSHIHRGILDLVFDTSNSNDVSSLSSAQSNHFVIFLSKSEEEEIKLTVLLQQNYIVM